MKHVLIKHRRIMDIMAKIKKKQCRLFIQSVIPMIWKRRIKVKGWIIVKASVVIITCQI